MAGNIWEWTTEYIYNSLQGYNYVTRGGSWISDATEYPGAYLRVLGNVTLNEIGFHFALYINI